MYRIREQPSGFGTAIDVPVTDVIENLEEAKTILKQIEWSSYYTFGNIYRYWIERVEGRQIENNFLRIKLNAIEYLLKDVS